MRNKILVLFLIALLCVSLSCAAFAAAKATKVAPKATKAASVEKIKAVNKADAKFDQKKVLDDLWKAPNSAVVGTVDGVSVTKGELLKNMWFFNGPAALQDLLTQKMIEQAAAKAKVTITPQELQAKIQESLSRMGMSSVDQLLAQYKVTMGRFMSGTKLSALAEKIVQSQVKLDDADYDQYIKARHILVRFPQDEKDKTKQEEIAKKKIDEIAQKIKDGGDFAKLADENSEDPGNDKDGVKQGGDLGWFTKGRMVQEFETAAFAMQAGQVSEPVKTFYGYHIIKLDKLGKTASTEEKAELKAGILEKKIPTEMGKWFSDLQAKAKIDNKLQGPAVKPAQPAMRPPQPAPRPAPRPQPVEVKSAPAEKPGEAPTSEKPDMPPPPPPPPAPAP